MNAAQVIDHFDRICDAPDAIPRLRRFILDLALRGKLADQNPNDEPASELFKRIQAEKTRLIQAGEIKKLETFEAVGKDEIPFTIPSGWEVVRMASLARKLGAGSTPLGGKSAYQSMGVPFLRSQNVHDDGLRLDDVAFISRAIHDRMSGTHVQQHDILLNITGASIGRCALVPSNFIEGNVSQHVAIIRLFNPAIREFIHLSLTAPFFQEVIDNVQVGVSREGLSMQRLRVFPMLLPPLAEQHRIVAKVNALNALCDRLETAQAERESRRDKLAGASLHRLNNGADADEFREHARFHLRHLPRLTTRPEHIQQLRQTILNLAVRGKLVQSGGSAVTAEQIETLKAERLAMSHSKTECHQVNEEFKRLRTELTSNPEQTLYIKTLCACQFITKGTTPAQNELLPKGDVPFIKVYNIVNNKLEFDYRPTFVSRTVHEKLLKRSIVRPGDLLMNIVGPPLGKVALVTGQYPEWNINQALVFFRPLSMFNNHFIALALSAPITIEKVLGETRGTVGQDNLSLEQVRSLSIPLITLENQARTVAKINELVVLCDRLEAQLNTAQAGTRRLLEAVLYDAFRQ